MMRLRRLIQPRNPAFWWMVLLNGLSTALVWITQHRSLSTVAVLMVAVFAIGNAVLGLRFARRLWHTPLATEAASPPGPAKR